MPRVKTRTIVSLFAISFASFALFTVWDVLRSRNEIDAGVSIKSDGRPMASPLQGSVRQFDDGPVDNRTLTQLFRDRNELPWFMKGGTLRPDNRIYPFYRLPIWPDEAPEDDRIINQLMYVPQNYKPSLGGKVSHQDRPLKKILLYFGRGGWNARDLPMGQTRFLRDRCPVNHCELSIDANEADKADVIFFKDRFQWPKHRRPAKQIWLLFLLECPTHTQSFRNLPHVFNWTATYRSDSDIVAPYEKYYARPISQKTEAAGPSSVPLTTINRNGKTKKVAWFVSNCGAKNNRLEYAQKLSRHIEVDIYGSCGQKRCPRYKAKQCFDKLNNDYKYYLAFENSNCRDYISEKYFTNSLMNRILPIAMGARREEYRRASPPHSFIHVDDFESPKALAQYLDELDRNETLYEQYFEWKNQGEFVNTYFWCRLCAMLHSPRAQYQSQTYPDMNKWWAAPGTCQNKGWVKHPTPADQSRATTTN